ncbi:separase/separin [Conoideocrella luteorostrata]|uniref:cutinase n=1 Tax=Conoideocrella luteorostrata TaxID=1105319 RepID=A0AAJ0CR36_9HYPO|nr:separase/separin [Conoideocrella luteorostrata]
MRLILPAALFGLLAAAVPTPVQEIQIIPGDIQEIDARQAGGITRDELDKATGACPPVIFIYARGSTEPGNMGITLGPIVAKALDSHFGEDKIWIQGVGKAYTAGLGENFLPAGTSPEAIKEMTRLLTLASTKCPNANILAGGYSQGAALTAATISALDAGIRNKIVGTVLFGYTKNQQNKGQIPNYPADRLKVFCNQGDAVCTGTLIITPAHLGYGSVAAGAAPEFLISKVTTA